MRNTIIVVLTIMTMVMIGCNRKREVVKRYPPGTSPRTSSTTAPSLGRAGNPATDTAGDPAAEETKDGDEADEGDTDADESAKGDEATGDQPNTPPAAAKKTPDPNMTAASRIGRRNIPGLNRAGGGAVVDSDETAPPETAKQEEPPADNTDDVASNDQPTSPPVDDPPDEEPRDSRKTFFDRAVQAFQNEHENEGFQFLYAHALTEDGALKDHPMAWYNGLNEPRLGLRWGIGIEYNTRRFDGDPPKIGDPVGDSGQARGGGGSDSDTGSGPPGSAAGARNLGRGNARNRPGGNRTSAPPSSADAARDFDSPGEELDYYTGNFGLLLVNRFEMRRDRNYYGQALKDIDLDATFEVESPAGSRAAPPPDAGNDMATASDQTRRGRGGIGGGRGGGSDTSDDEPDYDADPTSLAPGLMMLGVGKKSDLLEKAQEYGLDLLVLYDVDIEHSQSRNKTTNRTKAYLYSVKSPEDSLTSTKQLNNHAVWSEIEEGSSDDPIEAELDKIFNEAADKDFMAGKFPEWIKDKAPARATWLAQQEHRNPLPALVEIKAFHEAGMITRDQYINAFEALVGPDKARILIEGSIAEREDAISQWLPGKMHMGAGEEFR